MSEIKLSTIHIAPLSDMTSTDSYGAQCASYFNKTGEIDYVGYVTDEEFISSVDKLTDTLPITDLGLWSLWNLTTFSAIIEESLTQAFSALPLPDMPVQVFLFPWSGLEVSLSDFGGVNAVAPHENVIHLFIDPRYPGFAKSLRETIVHEYTHLYYYQTSDSSKYTLYEDILMEGIAEVFREEIVGGLPAAWSTALDKKQTEKLLKKLSIDLSSTDEKLRQEVLFGGGEYKKWTGYSIGYNIVKVWRATKSNLKWDEFIHYLQKNKPARLL